MLIVFLWSKTEKLTSLVLLLVAAASCVVSMLFTVYEVIS